MEQVEIERKAKEKNQDYIAEGYDYEEEEEN